MAKDRLKCDLPHDRPRVATVRVEIKSTRAGRPGHPMVRDRSAVCNARAPAARDGPGARRRLTSPPASHPADQIVTVSSHPRIVAGVLGRVLPRFVVACAIVVTATTAGALPAAAWSNGVDGPNAYGTHDWILDHALDALGRRADWVCRGRRSERPTTPTPRTASTTRAERGGTSGTSGARPRAALPRPSASGSGERRDGSTPDGSAPPAGRSGSCRTSSPTWPNRCTRTGASTRRIVSTAAYESAVDSRSEASDDEYALRVRRRRRGPPSSEDAPGRAPGPPVLRRAR